MFRPVGLEELRLVFASGMRAFPPRLSGQPTFYPVLGREYAVQISSEWNTKGEMHAGYVTRFAVADHYAASFEVRVVGGREHRELWVPAERLNEFNEQLEGPIAVVDAFFGAEFKGLRAKEFGLKGKDAVAQFVALWGMWEYSLMDFHGEIAANREAVFLHYPYWAGREFVAEGVGGEQREVLLAAIRKAWSEVSPGVPLADLCGRVERPGRPTRG